MKLTFAHREGPALPLSAAWLFQMPSGAAYHARYLRHWHVARYQRRFTRAAGDPAKQRAALRWLLRYTFPWRFSYRLRGDPVEIILGDAALQARAIAAVIANVRPAPTPTPL